MARTIKTTTTRQVPDKPEIELSPFEQKLKRAYKEAGGITTLSMSGYLETFLSVGEADSSLHVFRHLRVTGNMAKVAAIRMGEVAPDSIEEYVLTRWGQGKYQFRPEYMGRYYSPASILYNLALDDKDDDGAAGSPGTSVPHGEVDEAIHEIRSKLSSLAFLKELKVIAGVGQPAEGGDEMKPAEIATLMQATMAPMTAMIDAANRRAEASEQRLHDMTMKLLESQQTSRQGMMPLFEKLIANPDSLQAILQPGTAPEGTDWGGIIRDGLKALAPVIQGLAAASLQSAGLRPPVAPTPGRPPIAMPPSTANAAHPTYPEQARVDDLRPTGMSHDLPPTHAQEGGAMPIPLNEEQEMAKEMLLDYVAKQDFVNAYAVLEGFPGFLPGQDGQAVPMGSFILDLIDPKVSPAVYLPQLAQLVPEARNMRDSFSAFVVYIQQRLLAEDEAAARSGANVTRSGADEEGGEET